MPHIVTFVTVLFLLARSRTAKHCDNKERK